MLGSVASKEDFRTTCRKAGRAVKVSEHCIFLSIIKPRLLQIVKHCTAEWHVIGD